MKEFILNNIDKICISLGGIFLFEILMKYNNLKYHNEYANTKIKNEKIYQIEMYKKTNINNYPFNNLFNRHNKLGNLYYIKFINTNLIRNRFFNSLTIVLKNNDTDYKIYNNIQFINPKNYLFYDNDKIFDIIISNLYTKKDCNNFLNVVQKYKNYTNIKYKIIQSCYTYCLYDSDRLKYICNDKNDLLIASLDENLKYFYISIICSIFAYFYKNK
jgi:hypothetical protein